MSWPSMMGHLVGEVPKLNLMICERALYDIGVCEVPPGSNRAPRIDEYLKRAGSPLGSYWCAAWATAVWEDCYATLPTKDRASCEVIHQWAKTKGTFKEKGSPDIPPGSLVLYGETAAHHVGIIIRHSPYEISTEGNAAFSGFSSNGEAVLVKRVDSARVLGYVIPTAH